MQYLSLASNDFIVPLASNNGHYIPLQFGPDQWIHLGHVAAQPKQPAAGSS